MESSWHSKNFCFCNRKILAGCRERCAQLRPRLDIILANQNHDSLLYVRRKEKTLGSIGALSQVHQPASFSDTVDLIGRLNQDPASNGILVQHPLPKGWGDHRELAQLVDPRKDVDGMHPLNQMAAINGFEGLLACTPLGILALLDAHDIAIQSKHCVVVGRSTIVGMPMSHLLLSRNATVTICHSHTTNLAEHTRQADILIVAVGQANLITPAHLKPGVVLIDVGINEVVSECAGRMRRIVGDVHPNCYEMASAYTPVPGGVGPMTVAMLACNLLKATELQLQRK